MARDYTEKWHHQQQISAAVGQAAPLMEPPLFRPFIETLMRGLPPAYRAVAAPVGALVQVVSDGNAGGCRGLATAGGWHLPPPGATTPAAAVTLAPADAWQLFTKGLSAAEARERAQVAGDEDLAMAALRMVAVMG